MPKAPGLSLTVINDEKAVVDVMLDRGLVRGFFIRSCDSSNS
jgi:hypothetical protein